MLHRKGMRRRIGIIALIAMLASVLAGLAAATAEAAPPEVQLKARSAILIDYTTGEVLYEKNADLAIPPASLTKLMTLHLAYKKIEEGTISKDQKVRVSERAWAQNWPGSSLMWLAPGDDVTVLEVMKGIAIPSGNDASVALAEHIAGTVEAFVAMMNEEAEALGFKTMRFADPAGLSAQNVVTAREFAQFARMYIQMHPDALAELHSVREFAYPQPHNNPNAAHPIPQENRNLLLWEFEGADGLKTGFIEESGYNLAATAKRGDMRLIAVLLGVPGANEAEGSRNRTDDAKTLLSWGFQNFVTTRPAVPEIPPVRVWKGEANEVALAPEHEVVLTVERALEPKLTATVHQEPSVIAPVKKGDKLGELIYAADGKEIARVALVAQEDVAQAGFFKRIWHAIWLWVTGLLGRGE